MSRTVLTRRRFLKTVGFGVLAAGYGGACTSQPAATNTSSGATTTARGLKILQQTHFVPAFDEWLDNEHAVAWGKDHNVTVTVDHLPLGEIYSKAAAEAAARAGHDIVGFVAPPAVFEGEVVDVADVVSALEDRLGPMSPLAKSSCYNPKTQKWIGVPDFWTPCPTVWRQDLWNEVEPGANPSTWDDVLRVGRKLKKAGHPLGIGLSADLDSNCVLRGLLYAYGASVQDEANRVVINSPQTIEALKMAAALFKETMPPEVLAWSASSNNNFLLSGSGSLVFNAISVLRTIEKKKPDLAPNVMLAAFPSGPAQQLVPSNITNVYAIWRFSPNIELAKAFLIDLIVNYGSAFSRSESYNLPAFPGSVKDLNAALTQDSAAQPADKYGLLVSADQWSGNFGSPGTSNAAEMEVMDSFIIPKMFALVAQDMLSASDAARWAESAITPIFEKWQGRGLI